MKKNIVIFLICLVAFGAFSQHAIKLTAEQNKKLQEIQRHDEQRKAMQSQMHVTRSDWNEQAMPKSKPVNSDSGCKLDPAQMKDLADTYRNSMNGDIGPVFLPHVIGKSRQIDRQCEQQKAEQRIPVELRKKPEPASISAYSPGR